MIPLINRLELREYSHSPVLSLTDSVSSLPLSRVCVPDREYLPPDSVSMEHVGLERSLSLDRLSLPESSLSQRLARVLR